MRYEDTMLNCSFFNDDAQLVAQRLLGMIIRVHYQGQWLAAQIIETEAYYLHDKASHASLGYTEKRRALFMPAGTIYMYHARGQPSLNISAQGDGNAVLIKSGRPFFDEKTSADALTIMQHLNPPLKVQGVRSLERLCAGQTLLCRSLGLRVADWDAKNFDEEKFYIETVNDSPSKIIQTTRLGIPKGRDEHLPYRFIDARYTKYCTRMRSLQPDE